MIEIQELIKTYGSVKALEGLNLSVPKGSLYGLLGPNGAGKTTTLRIICTLLAPDSGQVMVSGVNVESDPRAVRASLGYVAQEVAIDKILTGRELLCFQGDLYHLNRVDRDIRIQSLVKRLEMDEWIDRRCGSYSGGMRRRLDLATGLLHDPKLLVLDEPTVGLDIESRSTIWLLIRELISNGTTVLLSSHYLEEVESLSSQIAIIDSGKVIAEGTSDSLKDEIGGDRVTLRVREFSDEDESILVKQILTNIQGINDVIVNKSQGFSINFTIEDANLLPLVKDKLSESGLTVFAISQSRPSLDDVYLKATGRTLMDAELALAGKRDLKFEKKQSMR